VYSRFFKMLGEHQELLCAMGDELVEHLRKCLPDFGKHLADDTKGLGTHARGRRDPKDSSDPDADWGMKVKRGQREDGTWWEKTTKWFGYKLHLIVDAQYELPVAWQVTQASASDSTHLLPMLKQLRRKHPELVQDAEYMSADKGYDSEKNNRELWDEYHIKPVIPAREMWKQNNELPRQLYPERVDTLFYDQQGQVLCRCLNGAEEAKNYAAMAFEGFEEKRGCLKYRCPATAHGVTCTQRDMCNGCKHTKHGRIVRVPLEKDRRLFVPLARPTYAYEREYKKRTAVERVNSRIDGPFGMEKHYVRGKAKMELKIDLIFVLMLAMAAGRLQAGQVDRIRSLLKPAAD